MTSPGGRGAPLAIEQSIASQQLEGVPFSPGRPIGPFNGYSTTPREHDFPVGFNIVARPRNQKRVSFQALQGLIEAYDFAQLCIWHKINSIRSLKWSLVPAPEVTDDVSSAVAYAKGILKRPDRKNSLSTVLAMYLWDVFAYDAGTLYRVRNNADQVIGFKHIDGTTVAPLIDGWGGRPDAPAPAFTQFYQGVPQIWFTENDLIYEPFRPDTQSPYGRAPIESVLLAANTDIRMQSYFLQRFTDGNVPEAFAMAPEDWTPDQIDQFQARWDAVMYGDQSQKHQVKWMPGGGKGIVWSNEKDFSDEFSVFLAQKTMAAFSIMPSELGFTDDVNKSTSDGQADVQQRIGDLPPLNHVEMVLTNFLQEDLCLPLCFEYDKGDEEEDKLATAQTDQIYWQLGSIGSDELREMRYGLPVDPNNPIGRTMFTARGGPIPLSAVVAVQGPIDLETFGPQAGAVLPHHPFTPVEGVVPNPPPQAPALAVQRFPAENQPVGAGTTPPALGGSVAKAETVGLTSDTGVTSYDLVDDEDEQDAADELAKAVSYELSRFRTFRKARVKAGKWRDFTFTAVDPVEAAKLNAQARRSVVKAAVPDDVPLGQASNPRWHRPVRLAESKSIDYHAAAIRAALKASVSRDALVSLVQSYAREHGNG